MKHVVQHKHVGHMKHVMNMKRKGSMLSKWHAILYEAKLSKRSMKKMNKVNQIKNLVETKSASNQQHAVETKHAL
jgi:hypothetical protein